MRRVNISIDEETHKWLKRTAKETNRTITGLLRYLKGKIVIIGGDISFANPEHEEEDYISIFKEE